MRIIFFGSPDFSAEVLKTLAGKHEIVCVVTGVDKPVGRGYAMKSPPLKDTAVRLGIPVLQFAKVSKEGYDAVAALHPDLGITAAFGQILSERFIELFPNGILNVHASLLPRWRGASPVQSAILNGDKETGITIMRTVREVDAGDILLSKRIAIGEKECAGELFDRLATLGGEAICEAVDLMESGKAQFTPQDSGKVTHCAMITKANGSLKFDRSYEQIDAFVRGMTPWPSAYCEIAGKRVKVLEVVRAGLCGEVGEVLEATPANGLIIGCEGGSVRIKQLQPDGKGRMTDNAFLLGNRINKGDKVK